MNIATIGSLKEELKQLEFMLIDDFAIGESAISRRIEKIESILASYEDGI